MKIATAPVKFLLVDDSEKNLIALEALLRKEGLELLTARSGIEALELLLVHDVALALLDVQMPEMDGFTLAELMRGSERSRHVPIIFITAGEHDHRRVFKGYDAGAVDFLYKPIEPQILRHKVDTFFQLYRQRQQLAETLRLNELFVAAVGHDLRTPLNAFTMGAHVLTASADPDVKRTAERLWASAQRMSRIIDDLFDLSRARLGDGIPITRKSCDAGEIATHVVAELDALNPGRVELTSGENLRGDWDASRIQQVLSNLIGNALRHGTPGQPVRVTVMPEAGEVRLSVHNGGEISADVLPHIFDAFRSGKRHGAVGLGLGLFIVEQIVLAHGGRIEVRSNATEGTTFCVHLPRGPQSS